MHARTHARTALSQAQKAFSVLSHESVLTANDATKVQERRLREDEVGMLPCEDVVLVTFPLYTPR